LRFLKFRIRHYRFASADPKTVSAKMNAPEAGQTLKRISVTNLSVLPPVYGGVSVHVMRLHRRLCSLGASAYVHCQPGADIGNVEGVVRQQVYRRVPWLFWLFELGWRVRSKVVHCHYGWLWAPAMWVMVQGGRKVVMTMHDQMLLDKWRRAWWFARFAARRLIRSKRVWWVAVSEGVRDQLTSLGVQPARIFVIPPFIAPETDSTSGSTLPEEICRFFKTHSPVLSTYANKLICDSRGDDLYGLDLCIGVLPDILSRFPNAGLIVCLGSVPTKEREAALQQRVSASDLDKRVLFIREPLREAWRLWKATDLYVRATSTDGDSLAVREALSVGVPVVASDCALRPEGVELFRNRDGSSLEQAIRRTLSRKSQCPNRGVAGPIADYFDPVCQLYDRLQSAVE